jgi:Fur family peroxide stress response transcriptional regulator
MKATEILKNKNIQVTTQRIRILEFLIESNSHLTAEQIFSALKNRDEIFSFATVYNTLTILVNNGILKKICAPQDKAIYDLTLEDHFHFYCRKCNKIIDVSSDFVDIKRAELKGHIVDSFHGYFLGTCKECFKEVKQKKLLNLFKRKVKIFKGGKKI